MEPIKIANFRRAHSSIQFPKFDSLDAEGCTEVRQVVAARLGLPSDCMPCEVTSKLHEQPGAQLGRVPEVEALDLRCVLRQAGVEAGNRVFLNWYHFDDIDEMDVDELSRYFDDIWYPASDDLDLFDGTFSWVLSVYHSGRMVLYRLVDDHQDA